MDSGGFFDEATATSSLAGSFRLVRTRFNREPASAPVLSDNKRYAGDRLYVPSMYPTVTTPVEPITGEATKTYISESKLFSCFHIT